MESYMYKYTCPGKLYGNYTGLRNVYVKANLTDKEASSMAKEDITKSTGYEGCSVTLLVKYIATIESIKTYVDITKIPFSEPCENIKKISLD
jgi:hypothetical protein